MATLAGFIDVGFLRGEGRKALGDHSAVIHPEAAVQWLRDLGRVHDCPEFLRVYWYDGQFPPTHGAHSSQLKELERIRQTPGIQVRLGYMQKRRQPWQYPLRKALENYGVDLADFQTKTRFEFSERYEQKGVDTLIVLDLVRLAQRRAYDTAILICGDRDVAEAVRVAQDEGRRVIIAYPHGAGFSQELRHLADELIELDKDTLRKLFVAATASATVSAIPAAKPGVD